MNYLSDILVTFACLSAAAYCLILSRRLKKLANLENGLGKEISELSQKIAETQRQISAATTKISEPSAGAPSASDSSNAPTLEKTKETIHPAREKITDIGAILETPTPENITLPLKNKFGAGARSEVNANTQGQNGDTGRLPSLRKSKHP